MTPSRVSIFLRRWSPTVVALGLSVFALSTADPETAAEALGSAGVFVVIASASALGLATMVDVAGWRLVCASMGVRAPVATLVRARLGIEAITLAAPGSALTAGVAAPFLLRGLLDVPFRDAVSAVLLRKWGTLAGHSLLLAFGAAIGGAFLVDASRALAGGADLRLALACLAAVLVIAAVAARRLLRGDERGIREAFFRARDRRDLRLAIFSFGLWLVECLEVYCSLRLLGVRPTLGSVIAMEGLVSVLRTVCFFLPGGLGVRELGHVTLIALMPGGSGAIAAAYAVLRRCLEVVYAIAGFALARGARRARAEHRRRGAPVGFEPA